MSCLCVLFVKGSVRDSVWTSEFNIKHLKKAEGYISSNIVSMKISPKVNVKVSLEFEPTYYDVAVLHFSLYATETFLQL